MYRWPCKVYLKGTCNNSFCEQWHPPECLFYKTKSGCRFGGKVLIRTPSGWWTADKKVQKEWWQKCSKGDWHESELVVDCGHDRSGQLGKKRDHELERGSTGRQSSNARQLGCVFQDMTPPKSILRKSTNMQRPIQRVKFTKAIARHTKIRDQNRSDIFAQVKLISVTPTLQNLRIRLRKRRNGKSDVPVKQRGNWPKMS